MTERLALLTLDHGVVGLNLDNLPEPKLHLLPRAHHISLFHQQNLHYVHYHIYTKQVTTKYVIEDLT